MKTTCTLFDHFTVSSFSLIQSCSVYTSNCSLIPRLSSYMYTLFFVGFWGALGSLELRLAIKTKVSVQAIVSHMCKSVMDCP